MKVLDHPDPRPTVPRARALRLHVLSVTLAVRRVHPLAGLALASLLLASCTDDVAAKCPPLRQSEALTVAAAAGNPCAARAGESAVQLRDRRRW